MKNYVALAVELPRGGSDQPPEEVARGADLEALAAQVLRLAPRAELRLHDRPLPARLDGLPIWGRAREVGRVVYLCGPA